jgi:hypothetical protein
VTNNLGDFPDSVLAGFGIESWNPDQFVTHLLSLHIAMVCDTIKELRARLKKPPMSPEDYLANLEKLGLPVSVSRLRPFVRLI